MAPPTPLTVLNVNYEEVEILQSLDRGAFGEVYVGRWRGNEVAVKVRMFSVFLPTYHAPCCCYRYLHVGSSRQKLCRHFVERCL